jgi:TfoX/Sxy family transcriptional regulator of competence genes
MPAKRAMPKFTKPPEALVALFGRAVGAMPDVEMRKMFGYPAAFVSGQMFTCLFQDSMIVRLAEGDRAAFLEKGARMFEPMPGRPMREYVAVPADVLASEAQLRDWLRRGYDYAASRPPKRGGRKKKTAAKKR